HLARSADPPLKSPITNPKSPHLRSLTRSSHHNTLTPAPQQPRNSSNPRFQVSWLNYSTYEPYATMVHLQQQGLNFPQQGFFSPQHSVSQFATQCTLSRNKVSPVRNMVPVPRNMVFFLRNKGLSSRNTVHALPQQGFDA